jgi:hypothetical protein
MNFLSNNLLNVPLLYLYLKALNGYLFFAEIISFKWCIGILFLLSGMLMIDRDKTSKTKNE